MERNWYVDGWDRSQSVRERMGMDVKGAGTGDEGTEIPFPCRPPVQMYDRGSVPVFSSLFHFSSASTHQSALHDCSVSSKAN